MRTELLRFNGAVERDPAIDAWMKSMRVNWEVSRASRLRSEKGELVPQPSTGVTIVIIDW